MKFSPALRQARLIKRYKRFLADVILPDGCHATIHCPNTGSMKNCAPENARVWYSQSSNSKRKYPFTWELVEIDERFKVSINTGRANALVAEALCTKLITPLAGYGKIQAEVKYGNENSRIDFLLSEHPENPEELCYVEVKSVTLALNNGLGVFPDAVSSRGAKHLRELMQMKANGHRAVLLYCVQHEGIERVQPAYDIDPNYASLLQQAHDAGVEIYAYRARITPQEIVLEKAVPFQFSAED